MSQSRGPDYDLSKSLNDWKDSDELEQSHFFELPQEDLSDDHASAVVSSDHKEIGTVVDFEGAGEIEDFADVKDSNEPDDNFNSSEPAPALTDKNIQDDHVSCRTTSEATSTKLLPSLPSFQRYDDHNLKGCFGPHIEDSFISYMHNKPETSKCFSVEKYNEHCTYLTEGRSILKSLTGKQRESYGFKLRRTEKRYHISKGKLFRNHPKKPIPVVVIEDLIPLVYYYHSSLAHAGIRKTWQIIKTHVHGITSEDITWLLLRCSVCNTRRANKTRSSLTSKTLGLGNERTNTYRILLLHGELGRPVLSLNTNNVQPDMNHCSD